MAGTKTAPHADWGDARNFAVDVGQKVWYHWDAMRCMSLSSQLWQPAECPKDQQLLIEPCFSKIDSGLTLRKACLERDCTRHSMPTSMKACCRNRPILMKSCLVLWLDSPVRHKNYVTLCCLALLWAMLCVQFHFACQVCFQLFWCYAAEIVLLLPEFRGYLGQHTGGRVSLLFGRPLHACFVDNLLYCDCW